VCELCFGVVQRQSLGHQVHSLPMFWVGFRIWNIFLDKVACECAMALQTLKSQNLSHMLAVMKFISRDR